MAAASSVSAPCETGCVTADPSTTTVSACLTYSSPLSVPLAATLSPSVVVCADNASSRTMISALPTGSAAAATSSVYCVTPPISPALPTFTESSPAAVTSASSMPSHILVTVSSRPLSSVLSAWPSTPSSPIGANCCSAWGRGNGMATEPEYGHAIGKAVGIGVGKRDPKVCGQRHPVHLGEVAVDRRWVQAVGVVAGRRDSRCSRPDVHPIAVAVLGLNGWGYRGRVGFRRHIDKQDHALGIVVPKRPERVGRGRRCGRVEDLSSAGHFICPS